MHMKSLQATEFVKIAIASQKSNKLKKKKKNWHQKQLEN